MSEVKHTPGPWSYCIGNVAGQKQCSCCQVSAPDFAVASCDTVNDEGAPYPELETRKANARLIAAAPEMYDLLLEIYHGDRVPRASIGDLINKIDP